MSDYMEAYKVSVPEGALGDASVDRIEVTREDCKLFNLRLALSGYGYRTVEPGTYTRLIVDGVLMMSDTQAEIRDHLPFLWRARGRVLVTGLGLGVVTKGLLDKAEVQHVTVIERNANVIALVAPHYACDRLTVICADALTWRAPQGARYDCIWHDIWPSMDEDRVPEITRLCRRYGHWLAPGGVQSAWGKRHVMRERRWTD
jgi:spermidine synthase